MIDCELNPFYVAGAALGLFVCVALVLFQRKRSTFQLVRWMCSTAGLSWLASMAVGWWVGQPFTQSVLINCVAANVPAVAVIQGASHVIFTGCLLLACAAGLMHLVGMMKGPGKHLSN